MKTQSSPPKLSTQGHSGFSSMPFLPTGSLWLFWNSGTGFIRKGLEEQKLPFPKPNLKEEDSRSGGAGSQQGGSLG